MEDNQIKIDVADGKRNDRGGGFDRRRGGGTGGPGGGGGFGTLSIYLHFKLDNYIKIILILFN